MAKQKSTGKGAKTKKKSWTKVKVKEKLNNSVFLEKRDMEKVLKEVPKMLCVTRAALCEKFKISGSVARAIIKDFYAKSLLVPIGDQHSSFDLYKGAQAKSATEKAEQEAAEAANTKKKKGDKDKN